MKQPKGRKMLAGVFGALVFVLIIDRVLLQGGPSDARADDPAPPPALAPNQTSGPPPTASERTNQPRRGAGAGALAARFEDVAGDLHDVDLTTLPNAFVPDASVWGEKADRFDSTAIPSPEEMLQRHRLTAVMQGSSPGALITGQFYREGGTIDGYEVVSIRARSVLLRSGNLEVALPLDEDSE